MGQRGRPKSVEPIRDRVVPVRFTEDEHGEVSAAAAAEGVTLSAFLRARGVASAKRALRREAGSADG
ncbi:MULTISPECIES: plasmid mobilization protein [Nocardiaceae]